MINYFLIGILFAYMFLPIIESITGVICTYLEALKAKGGLIITKTNNQISKINSEAEQVDTCQIGFQYTTSEEDDEEDYED